MWIVATPVGVFIGILSAFIFLLVLRTALHTQGLKHLAGIVAQLITLASFSLGGSWLAAGLFETVDRHEFVGPYLLAFTVAFFAISFKGLYRAMVKLGNQIGVEESVNK